MIFGLFILNVFIDPGVILFATKATSVLAGSPKGPCEDGVISYNFINFELPITVSSVVLSTLII